MSDATNTEHNRGANQTINYEIKRLEEIAEDMPTQMREPFLWLGQYMRETCGRKIAVLETRVQELGFAATSSTFSKIFRGQWKRSAKGKVLDSPIVSVDNFLEIVEKLQSESRLAESAGEVPFIATGTTEKIFSYIDDRRAPGRICKFGLIVGPTGSQRTASFKQYQKENNHGSCVWTESPVPPTMGRFITNLAHTWGIPRHLSLVEKERRVLENINRRRCIILDNVQELHVAARGGNQPIFSWTRQVQDQSGCTFIFSITPEHYETFIDGVNKGYFEQFIGRCGGLKEILLLPKYTPREDILAFARAFKLQGAEKHVAYLDNLAREYGRVRVLLNALQVAKQDADDADEPLTIDHIKSARGEEIKEAA